MTEKRFVVSPIWDCIYDESERSEKGVVFYDCSDDRIMDLCELLNHQHETIQSLRETLATRSNETEILKHLLLQFYTIEEIEAELI